MFKRHINAPRVVTDPVEAIRREVYDRHALEACASLIGTSHQVLSRMLNPEEEAQLSAHRAAAIADFLDTDCLAECHAARRGGVFARLPPPTVHDEHVLVAFAGLALRFAELARTITDAVSDGSITSAEVEELEAQLRALYASGEGLAQLARQRVRA